MINKTFKSIFWLNRLKICVTANQSHWVRAPPFRT